MPERNEIVGMPNVIKPVAGPCQEQDNPLCPRSSSKIMPPIPRLRLSALRGVTPRRHCACGRPGLSRVSRVPHCAVIFFASRNARPADEAMLPRRTVRRCAPVHVRGPPPSDAPRGRHDPTARRPTSVCDPYENNGKPLSQEQCAQLLPSVSDSWALVDDGTALMRKIEVASRETHARDPTTTTTRTKKLLL